MEKTDLMALVNTRNEELAAMDQQLQELMNRLTSVTEKNVDSDLKVELVSLRETSLNQREARLVQEAEIKNRRIQTLESELERLTRELMAARREQTTLVTDLESKLEQKSDQVKRLKEEVIHVRSGSDAKDNHMSLMSGKLRKQQELAEKLQKQYSSQTQSLEEMLRLESASLENEKKRNEKLVEAIRELQELLKCSKESHSQMEERLIEKTTEYETSLGSKDFNIRRLEREVELLKEKLRVDPREQLEQELEVFYPAASRASRSLRDRSMMSFTSSSGGHSSVDDLNDELNRLREENARLISEAEENAPLTLAKMLEHKKAVEMIAQLQNQLGQAVTERNNWIEEKETMLQLSKETERRLRRFEQENEDLSAQVRSLLHALEDSSGRSLAQQVSQYARRSSGTSANDVVTTHLVTFQSVEELQVRNRQLLAALRELSEDHDATESMTVAIHHDGGSSGDQLQKALREIDSLKNERRKQSEMIDAVIRQRDALQSIAAAFTPLESFYRIQPKSNVPDPNVEYLKEKLEQREKELSEIRKQLQERTKEAGDEIMKLKDEIMNVKIEERNLSSRLETTQTGLEAARSIVEQSKIELQSLRDRIVSERKDNKKIDQELKKTKNELSTLNEKVKKNEDLVKHLTEERDMFKASESTLRVELESLRREQQSNVSIGETTKTLQAYIARIEADASRARIAEALVEKLEKENAQLKNRIAKQAREAAEADESSSKRVEELKKTFITEQTEEIERLRTQVTNLQGENQELKKNVISAKSTVESGASKRIAELEEKLTEKSREVTRLENEVQKLTNEVTNLKKMCTDKEEKFKRAIAQLNSERKTAAEQPSAEVTELQSKVTELQSKVTEFQTKNDSLQEKLKESMNQTKLALANITEKDEKLKKIANQARQRISGLQDQVKNLLEQKQTLQVQNQSLEQQTQSLQAQVQTSSKSEEDKDLLQQLRTKVSNLEEENEDLLRFRLLNANLEAKLKQIERENQELVAQRSQLEKLRDQPEPVQEQTFQVPVSAATTVTFVPPNNSSVQAPPTQPVRPLPQQQPQPTKTATINPLPHLRPPTSTIAHVIPTQQSQPSVPVEVDDEARVDASVPEVPVQSPPAVPVVEEQREQMVVEEHDVPEEARQEEEPESSHSETPSQKRTRPESPVNEPETSKRAKTEESSVEGDTATRTSGVESSDTNEDSSDRRPAPLPQRDVVVDDVIVIDVDSDDGESDGEGGEGEEVEEEVEDEDASGSEVGSESGHDSSVEGKESDEEYSEEEEREIEEDAEQDDGEQHEDQDEEAVIVIGESNESQNDSRLSTGEQVVQDEEVERDDAEASVGSQNSQLETSSTFNEHQSSQVFAVPEEQRIVSRPTYLGQPGPSYEESDSIVPSTPTLVVPRRGDGPESLNSPRVPQNSFQFSNVSREGSPGIPTMEGENRLDDTRIDLSQFSDRQQTITSDQSEETPQLIVPDESASMSAESVTPEPPTEGASTSQEVQEAGETQVGGQTSSDHRVQPQPVRQPIVWNAPTSIAPVRGTNPEQASASTQPPGVAPTRPRRLQLRGTRTFQQTARRAQGWRGSRGRGGGGRGGGGGATQ